MKFDNIQDIINRSQFFDQNNKDLIKNEGVVFTGIEICNRIINNINPKINETVCEPSVGRGSFVFALLEKFRRDGYSVIELKEFIENNLFCYDINKDFISELKNMIKSYLNILGYNDDVNLSNIKCEDFLIQKKHWDNIIGNPPYVRIQNLDKDYLDLLKNDLKSVTLGNIDLYYAFLEKSIKSSNKVGFIIPNSFIKTKSGKFLREIIKDNVTHIYDFCADKVWDKISTYTCIVICENVLSNTINYQTKNSNILKEKSNLSDDKWIFIEQEEGSVELGSMINYCSGGLATIKDNIYKIDNKIDGLCTKGNYKIEPGLCRKVIKATKSRKFDDYKWIIYPYDKNGKVISEDFLSTNYPLGYEYLLSSKSDLNTRDKGKTDNYDSWYAYGRRQGILKAKSGRRIILPLTFLRSKGIYYIEVPDNEECLVLSGILVDIKEECFESFIEIISSDRFYTYCECNNKTLKDKNESDDIWLSITTTTLKKFKY